MAIIPKISEHRHKAFRRRDRAEGLGRDEAVAREALHENRVLALAPHFAGDLEAHALRGLDVCRDLEQVVVAGRALVVQLGVDHRQHPSLGLALAVGVAARPHQLVAGALEECEVVAVVDNAHLVGICVGHAVFHGDLFHLSVPFKCEGYALIEVVRGQRVEERIHLALDYAVQRIEGKVDAVVGHPVLRKVVGTDALRAVARAAQRETVGAELRLLLAALEVEDARLEGREALLAVALLAALILADRDEAGRQVGHADGALGLVHMLAAGAAGAEEVDSNILLRYLKLILFVRLGENDDRRGGGMDSSLGLGLGHALDAVAAGLEPEASVCALAEHGEDDLLVAVERGRVGVHDGDFPSMRLAVAGIHAEEIAGEERGLLAAGAGADLHYGVAGLERVGRQERAEKAVLEVGKLRFKGRELGGGFVLEVGVVEKFAVAGDIGEGLFVGGEGGLELLEKGVVAERRTVALRV